MEMLEAALALLCAVGAGSLLWLLFGLLVRPAQGREPWVVLPGRGSGEDLEAGLRQLAWLRRAGLFRGEAVIWDEDLDREGRQLALAAGPAVAVGHLLPAGGAGGVAAGDGPADGWSLSVNRGFCLRGRSAGPPRWNVPPAIP